MEFYEVTVMMWWFLVVLLSMKTVGGQLFLHPDVSNASGLDPLVWASKAIVYYHANLSIKNEFRPICHFQNVFIDARTIYLKPLKTKKAMVDLFCCSVTGEEWDKLKCPTNSSVHQSLCYCVWNDKYALQLATPKQLAWLNGLQRSSDRPSNYLSGQSWLMHHWSVWKHPDHFTMRLLEYCGIMANHLSSGRRQYPFAPDKVDRLVSMDYDVYPMSEYERFVISIVDTALGYHVPYITLSPPDHLVFEKSNYKLTTSERIHSFCEYLKHMRKHKSNVLHDKDFINITNACDTEVTETIRLNYWYMESGFISAIYKHNIPEPVSMSLNSISKAVDAILRNESLATQQRPRLVVMNRVDGTGLRKFLNLDDVVREMKKQFCSTEITLVYVDGKTPPEEQARIFNSFELLVSPHSSQLTNLIFSRSKRSVIEIQPQVGNEPTFMNLGHKVGLHYQLLNENHTYRKNGQLDSDKWREWDIGVNMQTFQTAVIAAKQHLISQGLFPGSTKCLPK